MAVHTILRSLRPESFDLANQLAERALRLIGMDEICLLTDINVWGVPAWIHPSGTIISEKLLIVPVHNQTIRDLLQQPFERIYWSYQLAVIAEAVGHIARRIFFIAPTVIWELYSKEQCEICNPTFFDWFDRFVKDEFRLKESGKRGE